MKRAKVYRADLYGLREGKYTFLQEHDVSSTQWQEVSPQAPFYLFANRDEDVASEFDNYWNITVALPLNVLGFQTHRDQFAISFSRDTILTRIWDIRSEVLSDEEATSKYNLKDNRGWKLADARQKLRQDLNWERPITECLYRPFDKRYCYFSPVAMDRPRRELLRHVFDKENICLGLGRQGIAVNDPQWSLIAASRIPTDANIFRRGGINVFPLYLYSTNSLFDTGLRRPNLSPEFVAELSEKVGLRFIPDGQGDLTETFGPEDVFHYIYAVFHAPGYRSRYAEFLKIDFPRVPLTGKRELLQALAGYGRRLVALHLLEARGPDMTSYPVAGDNVVDKPRYQTPQDGAAGRVWVNASQYFEGVPPEVWAFHVGGYQVCEKWLKDRKGRELGYDDLRHYSGIVAALAETLEVMHKIDETVAAYGGWPLS